MCLVYYLLIIRVPKITSKCLHQDIYIKFYFLNIRSNLKQLIKNMKAYFCIEIRSSLAFFKTEATIFLYASYAFLRLIEFLYNLYKKRHVCMQFSIKITGELAYA